MPFCELAKVTRRYEVQCGKDSLVEKDLLDSPLEFLGPDLISGADDQETMSWREFLNQLSVDGKLSGQKQHLVQRVGIKTALLFEKERQRAARELGESEKRGYDIVSRSSSGERHVEVKGSRGTALRRGTTKD